MSYSVLAGKAIQRVARMRGGSGSALPGLIIERIDPGFMKRTLDQLPHGVVVISGTNGKTTTTKMVVALLESQGLRVFTNRTGSNFTRGVAAALLADVDRSGKLDADIAVLELDEAHAVHFVRMVPPRYSLFLNVLRDQLDRFGEIDATAKLLQTIAVATTDGVVINQDDPRLASQTFTEAISAPDIRSYGVSEHLHEQFPSDDEMRGRDTKPAPAPHNTFADRTELRAIDGNQATFYFDDTEHTVSLELKGIYNIQNAAAALALVRLIVGSEIQTAAMLNALSDVRPAFGRGETIEIDGHPVELVLVKTPSGFRLSLASFDPADTTVMIAINDNYADGRDMSWLWDVEFESLRAAGVDTVTGIRAYDMALRLQYDLVDVSRVETAIPAAVSDFLARNHSTPKRIFCTYTAMLAIRRELSKRTQVEVVA